MQQQFDCPFLPLKSFDFGKLVLKHAKSEKEKTNKEPIESKTNWHFLNSFEGTAE